MATYNEIRSNIKTGDIVLFSGKGGVSPFIKWFTRSKWSHIGMALCLPEWDMVLLWESTTLDDIKDIEDGITKRGVQLVALSDRIRTYKGGVAVRHLSIGITESMRQQLSSFRNEVKNRPFEKDKIEMIKAGYDGPFGENIEDLSSLFCSEMVAEAYQRMGLLHEPPQGKPSNEYTPREFSSANTELELLQGATLGEEIEIT
ncbi:MAG: hypothetical protein HY999_03235 [Nitrospinae bacterium]|nr:hypothetical protein [Nitrospinota bacterium]